MSIFQTATPDDAEQAAQIVAITADGLVEQLFDGLIPDLPGTLILSAAFMKGEAPYLMDNIIRSMQGDAITSLLFSYPSSEHRVPLLMENLLPAKRLNPARPVLERSLPNSLYINTIWVDEQLRGTGMADMLMLEAINRCRELGFAAISLFCWNDNERALRFYARHGFTLREHLPPELLPLPGHLLGGSILGLAVSAN
jgi:GNAT superfamily N-acetyltransferase